MRGIKNKESGRWKRLIVFIILLIIFIVLLNSVNNVYKKKKETEKALTHMKEEVAKLEDRDQFLKDSIEKLKTKEGIDFEIRKKLNVAQVGESVAVIVDEKISSPTPPPTISSWQKFKDFFIWLFK
jgi:cell division protein FtsB